MGDRSPMTRNLKMHGGYTRRKIKALSERGKRMSTARWKLDRADHERTERKDKEMEELWANRAPTPETAPKP